MRRNLDCRGLLALTGLVSLTQIMAEQSLSVYEGLRVRQDGLLVGIFMTLMELFLSYKDGRQLFNL